jgi:hypothetical protein
MSPDRFSVISIDSGLLFSDPFDVWDYRALQPSFRQRGDLKIPHFMITSSRIALMKSTWFLSDEIDVFGKWAGVG